MLLSGRLGQEFGFLRGDIMMEFWSQVSFKACEWPQNTLVSRQVKVTLYGSRVLKSKHTFPYQIERVHLGYQGT